MRALHLFVTVALSLSATAYDASRPQRRAVGTAVPGNEVDALGIPNRDLSVLSTTSNTSDTHSLNMNRKRALDDPGLVRRSSMHTVRLTLVQGRFTGPVSFGGKPQLAAVFDTGSSTTWVKSSASSSSDTNAPGRPFTSVGIFKFTGHTAKGAVTVMTLDGSSSSEMEYQTVPGKTPNGYSGGLALDRSDKSWLTFAKIDVFAFYSTGHAMGEFHFGGLDSAMSNHLEWHEVRADGNKWTLGDAHIKVNGQALNKDAITMIDTGVWYIYGSANDVANLYAPLKGVLYSVKTGSWKVPCNEQTPVVSFSWGEKDFPINDFVLKLKDGETCLGTIRQRKDLLSNNWVLGVPFLHGKYTAFSKSKGVGFSLPYDASKL